MITGEDLGPLFPRFGHIVADHPILAIDKVRYLGEPVALVLAEDRYAAHDGAELVEVSYEDLPAVMDPDQALAGGAPLLHTTDYGVGDRSFEEAHSEPRSDNVCHRVEFSLGRRGRRSLPGATGWSRPPPPIRCCTATPWSPTTPWPGSRTGA